MTLIPAVATVRHTGSVSTKELIEAVEAAGYDASLVSSTPLSPTLSQVVSAGSDHKVKAVLAIGGMTCASCVGSIRSAVTPATIPGLLNFEVDLIGGRGSVETTDRAVVDKVRQEIDDVGFDCEVVEVVAADAAPSVNASSAPMRTARVRLVGMYCPDCTAKVTDILTSFHRSHGLVFTPFDHSAPVTTIRYVPSPPSFTLRDIKRAVEGAGFGFTVADEETSVDARAKHAQKQERVRILVRLGITFLFAIPAFIINVVGMSLLSSTNPFRRYWEEPVWGGASRGTVAMWVVATPVEFGVGWFFFSRAWKSLRGVWRKPRPGQSKTKVWVGRLFKWGSMDTLVALGTAVAYFASVAFMVLDITAGKENPSKDMGYFDTPIFLMCRSSSRSRLSHALTLRCSLHPLRQVPRSSGSGEYGRRDRRPAQDEAVSRDPPHHRRGDERVSDRGH